MSNLHFFFPYPTLEHSDCSSESMLIVPTRLPRGQSLDATYIVSCSPPPSHTFILHADSSTVPPRASQITFVAFTNITLGAVVVYALGQILAAGEERMDWGLVLSGNLRLFKTQKSVSSSDIGSVVVPVRIILIPRSVWIFPPRSIQDAGSNPGTENSCSVIQKSNEPVFVTSKCYYIFDITPGEWD